MTDARAFRGFRFPAEVILWAVRWYLQWTSPLGVEGLLTNPVTPGGQDGGEADPTAVHG
jgi:hypothetical protein